MLALREGRGGEFFNALSKSRRDAKRNLFLCRMDGVIDSGGSAGTRFNRINFCPIVGPICEIEKDIC